LKSLRDSAFVRQVRATEEQIKEAARIAGVFTFRASQVARCSQMSTPVIPFLILVMVLTEFADVPFIFRARMKAEPSQRVRRTKAAFWTWRYAPWHCSTSPFLLKVLRSCGISLSSRRSQLAAVTSREALRRYEGGLSTVFSNPPLECGTSACVSAAGSSPHDFGRSNG
jgi:hypothetical protein